ncbi:MAG: peptidoglycan DD-metalloendopeptidase family protein [Alphaproteobacteria bacterium]|jgi:murein DD-endopeptidase MepM/ murein hydrolase activator NlpD|nr:peptidoglycan DD-metalloendopeptidase family protein [Alphaproteobacteria bacterium]
MVNHFLKSNNVLKVFKLFIFIVIGLSLAGAKTNNVLSQNDIIQISERLRLNELELRNLEIYRNLLSAQKEQRETQLAIYKKTISSNIVSLYKLSISSANLLFYSEQSKKDALISYSLLTYYTNFIKEEITKAREYIALIQENNKDTQKIEKRILLANQEIKKNTDLLKSYLKHNNYTPAEIQKLKDSNTNLIKESSDLANLISNLNKKHYLKSEIETDNKVLANKGNFVWINVGFLESSFKKSPNPLYKNGIIILTLANSQIVSPFDGEILFVDNFDKFNKVIIIKHSASIYSVISGEFTPIIKQLQLVKKHEPIALSPQKISPLYFEIKHDSESVDPLKWLQKREN